MPEVITVLKCTTIALAQLLEDLSLGFVVQPAQKSCPGDQGGISNPLSPWMQLMHFRCPLGGCVVSASFQYSAKKQTQEPAANVTMKWVLFPSAQGS